MSINAMKQAIEALTAAATFTSAQSWILTSECREAIEALRTAIQQAEAKTDEPVAWIRRHPNGALSNELLIHVQVEQVRRDSGAWVPLYTHLAPGVPDDVVRDAERYRWLRASTFPKADQYPYRISTKPIRLPIGFDDQSTFDAAIDAAMLTAAQAQKGQP